VSNSVPVFAGIVQLGRDLYIRPVGTKRLFDIIFVVLSNFVLYDRILCRTTDFSIVRHTTLGWTTEKSYFCVNRPHIEFPTLPVLLATDCPRRARCRASGATGKLCGTHAPLDLTDWWSNMNYR
jgi:hypothetical protein